MTRTKEMNGDNGRERYDDIMNYPIDFLASSTIAL
jgi:hypothetical protein